MTVVEVLWKRGPHPDDDIHHRLVTHRNKPDLRAGSPEPPEDRENPHFDAGQNLHTQHLEPTLSPVSPC